MADALSAMLENYSQNPYHDKCFKVPNSWCSYNRDIATAKSTYRSTKDPLSPAIVTAIKPLFDTQIHRIQTNPIIILFGLWFRKNSNYHLSKQS